MVLVLWFSDCWKRHASISLPFRAAFGYLQMSQGKLCTGGEHCPHMQECMEHIAQRLKDILCAVILPTASAKSSKHCGAESLERMVLGYL